MKELEDVKVKAMYELLQELRYGKYDNKVVYKVLTIVEHRGIKYLLDELPEGQTTKFYFEKLEEFIMKEVKK